MSLFSSAHRPMMFPDRDRRTLRRPNLSHSVSPRLSAAPLNDSEVDYDDLIVHRTWRSFEPSRPDEVRYFLYELSQRYPGEAAYTTYFKAVRLLRLTRVPRYLRQGGGAGPNMNFEQMRDVLASLRERQVLFLNLIAKSPEMPLVFAYGVQAVGATPEEAMSRADESYAVLSFQLDGTYQQLEYKPLSVAEGEHLARYSAEWRNIAMARGRPLPQGQTLGAASLLDGNRTDIESSNNQLESFIRGMSDTSRGGFMLSLVTTPIPPGEISVAWRNMTQRASEVRSDQEGSRGVQAGVALPLAMGANLGDSHGSSHQSGETIGAGTAHGTSHSEGTALSNVLTDGTSHSVADGVSSSQTQGTSASVTDTLTQSQSVSASDGISSSLSDSASASTTAGESVSYNEGASANVTQGETLGQSTGQSLTHSVGESTSQSLGESRSLTQGQSMSHALGSSQSLSQGQSLSAGQSLTEGFSRSMAESLNQAFSLTNTSGDSVSDSVSQQTGTNASGGLFGFNGSANTSDGRTQGMGLSNQNAFGFSQTGGATSTTGLSSSMAQSLTQGATASATSGVSETMTAGQSVAASQATSLTQTQGASASVSAAQSVGQSVAQSLSVGQGQSVSSGIGQSLADTAGVSRSVAVGANEAQSVGASAGVSRAESQGVSQASTVGQTRTETSGVSHTAARGVTTSTTDGTSDSATASRGVSDAYTVAMTRQAAMTGSMGVVPQFGVVLTKAIKDIGKAQLGDILEQQALRYLEGVEGAGAYLYQMFLTAEDPETLAGAAGLLKSAFWGPGTGTGRVVQPFHVVTNFGPGEAGEAERQRLLVHAQALTQYRRREPVMEVIEPYLYSSYVTPGEAAAFCHPPTAEAIGLMAQADSMPVLRMPADRDDREVTLGRLVNGERARVDERRFGVDTDELTHMLISGITGSGKTTTLMRLLAELCQVRREITVPPAPGEFVPTTTEVPASILAFDWMRNLRHLGSITDPVRVDPATGERTGRYQFFSATRPELGAFRWNPLAVPHDTMDPRHWAADQADNFVAAMGLGEFGRSLISEMIDTLYRANRLEPFELVPARVDDNGVLLRAAITLDPVDASDLPPEAIRTDSAGNRVANVLTYPPLSRLVGMGELASLCLAKVEEAATVEGARLYGQAMRDRIQSLWRRLQYFTPGQQLSEMLCADPSLSERRALTLSDIVDPDVGLVTVIEAEGLDLANRRLILGSVLLALYKSGLHTGEGTYDHNGAGPGLFCVLEEAHELFRSADTGEDKMSSNTREALWSDMHRRIRAVGVKFIDVVQNPNDIPEAVTSNIATVFVHRTYADGDRKRVFSLLNWSNILGQQLREYRYLGEMPVGYCIARLHAKGNYLDSQPVQFLCDPPALGSVLDSQLSEWARQRP